MRDDDLPPLRLFLDRSTQGQRFVEAVRKLVDDVEVISERCGVKGCQTVADVQWIREATAAGRILVGADRNILRNRIERQEVCRSAARYVVFKTNNLSTRVMIELFQRDLPQIAQLSATPGPWAYRIAVPDLRRMKLDCSDAPLAV